ncbi:MAG: metal-dependent transcriptional regulator [Anaerolineaceae bacterium]|nr:metal-dependent transcriptional regulator [Anaerolineaceae bacterium]
MAARRGLLQSESVQNFLKSLLTLQQGSELVSTSAMAEILQISAPSVSDMTQRLEEAGLVSWRKWRGIRLTPAGENEALMILRRHRLIELFLVEELGYELPEVHAEAERLEHAVSERFIEAIASRLHEPGLDPHGDPIPAPDGTILRRRLQPLSAWPPDRLAVVSRIRTRSEDMLRVIVSQGITLNARVEIMGDAAADGPLALRVNGRLQRIARAAADCILVEAWSS